MRVEQLNVTAIHGHAMEEDTARWLEERDEILLDKLANAGLIAKLERATLDAFITAFKDGRSDIKDRTKMKYETTRKELVAFFGKNKPLREITSGDADDFRQMLIGKKRGENTIRKHVSVAKVFFNAAKKRRLVRENPFDHLSSATQSNTKRFYFVARDETDKVIEACPDAEWRLIFALARYGGLRCPSELLLLRLNDVNWAEDKITIHSPKTEHHAGHESRTIPIFSELRPYLEEIDLQAAPGTVYFINRYRDSANANLRTQLKRIIENAGLTPWPKLFQNLRSTRQTELEERFPSHVVCAWIGNSRAVAAKHYLQVTDAHFAKAVQNPVQSVQKAVQQPAASNRTDSRKPRKCESVRSNATPEVAGAGVEPARPVRATGF